MKYSPLGFGCLTALLVLWPVLSVGQQAERSVAYDTGSPRHWPVIYDVTFNGFDPIPCCFEDVAWTGDMSYGGGSSVVAFFPTHSDGVELIEVHIDWIEWTTGEAWTADLIINHDEDLGSLTFRMSFFGELTIYRPSPALLEGRLGRRAALDDYDVVATACASPIDQASLRYRDLAEARSHHAIPQDQMEAAFSVVPFPTACGDA